MAAVSLLRSSAQLLSRRAPARLAAVSVRHFSGPQEPPDTRTIRDVEPDFGDPHHWEYYIQQLEYDLLQYDENPKDFKDINREDIEYELSYARKMYEWRSLCPQKYMTQDEASRKGYLVSGFDQYGFKYRSELDYRFVGGMGGFDTEQAYYHDGCIFGPFGTEENPVYIPSRGRYRMVGCTGGYYGQFEHDLVYFVLRQGPKHRCPICGQIFQLWTSDPSHPDHPYHDPTRDYDEELYNALHAH